MENVPYVLLLLACPLGMVAMGAVAWIAGKVAFRQAGSGAGHARVTGGSPPASRQKGPDLLAGLDKRADDPPAGEPGHVQTFLFADLAGFTALTEAHGDERAADLARDFSGAVRELLAEYDAHEVKSLGDGLMIRGRDPSGALRLGLRIVREVGAQHGFPLVRVGIHTGPATERNGDWFGSSVNIAARVSNIAAGGEVLVTEAAKAAASPLDDIELYDIADYQLKNLSEPVKLYSAIPRGEQPGTKLPIDPVCRMAVQPERKAGLIVHEDVDYIFCSLDCAEAFAGSPERYLSPRAEPAKSLNGDTRRAAPLTLPARDKHSSAAGLRRNHADPTGGLALAAEGRG